MRSLLFVALLSLICTPLAPFHAAEKKPAGKPKPEAAPPKADDLVADIEILLTEEASGGPTSKRAVQAMWKTKLAQVDSMIAKFRKHYPDHPQRWDILYWEANSNEVRENVGLPKLAGLKPTPVIYAEVAAAADASKDIRIRASFDRVNLLSEQVLDGKMPLADWEKDLAAHIAAFPEYLGNHVLIDLRVTLLTKFDELRVLPLLEELAKDTNAEVSEMANKRLVGARARAEVKTKPMALKFKATDGTEVDLEKLRGKVVLVLFWASWSEPSMAELTRVQQTYAKFRDKGFEVLAISADYEEKEFKAAVKKRKITWPQYFDGKGWENPFTKAYDINDGPVLWLVNKQGLVVDMNPGHDLAAKVEKLQAE